MPGNRKEKYGRKNFTSGELAFTMNEYEKLHSCITNIEDLVMIELAISTGIRREDIGHGNVKRKRYVEGKNIIHHIITGIKVSDIDFEEKTLLFYESKKDRMYSVPIEDSLIQSIKMLLNTDGKKKRKYLISYSGRTCYNRLQEYCDKAQIPGRAFHVLRASCIKFHQNTGWSPEAVAKLTGDTIQTIQEHYLTPSYGEMKEYASNNGVLS